MRRVSPREAHELMCSQGYGYLDVRSVPEFDGGHPEGAYNVPWQVPAAHGLEANPDFLLHVSRAFDPDDPVVVGCASGVRSLAAAQTLEAAGYRQVVEQRAGFDGVRDPFGSVRERGWRELGLPSGTDAQTGRDYRTLSGKE